MKTQCEKDGCGLAGICDGCRVWQEMKVAAHRYEKIRRTSPREFAKMWAENLEGGNTFDSLVDAWPNKLVKEKK